MADADLSPPNYVKYAFEDQHNLVLLFGAACFSVAFASPWPLAIGVLGELLWLLVGPRLPAFRDWVDAQLSTQYLARAETAIEGALGQLQDNEVSRFVSVSRDATGLISAARERKTIRSRDIQLSLHSLLELRRTFLDYQFLAQRVTALIETIPTVEVEQEVAHLQEEYAAERELTLRMTIRQALNSAQKRLQQQQELVVINRTIEVRLEMLEKTVPNLRARLADPGFSQLSQELDKTLAEVGSAEVLELAVDATFDSATTSPSL